MKKSSSKVPYYIHLIQKFADLKKNANPQKDFVTFQLCFWKDSVLFLWTILAFLV